MNAERAYQRGVCSPIRPRPIKPHVACLCSRVANDLLAGLEHAEATEPLPRRHSLEGKKRTEMAAVMVDESVFQTAVPEIIWRGRVAMVMDGQNMEFKVADACAAQCRFPFRSRHHFPVGRSDMARHSGRVGVRSAE